METKSSNLLTNYRSYLAIVILFLLFITRSQTTPHSNQIAQLKSPNSGAQLKFSFNTINLNPEQEHSISLLIDNENSKLTGVTIELIYDPKIISLTSITPNVFFPNVLSNPTSNSGNTIFTYAVHPDQGGRDGSGAIALIKLKALALGDTQLTFGKKTTVSAINSNISVLDSSQPLSIFVNQRNTPSPSYIPTNPPNPSPNFASSFPSSETQHTMRPSIMPAPIDRYEKPDPTMLEKFIYFIKKLFGRI